MSNAGLVQVYTANPATIPTPIFVDALSAPLSATPVQLITAVPLAQLCPPGWPAPPDETGTPVIDLFYPRTIPTGTAITAFACVAAALIAAGAAVLG